MVAMPSVTATSIDMSGLCFSRFLALAAEQVARNHHAVHLGGTLADALDAHLAVPALERHLARNAEPAEHLDAAIDDLPGSFGGVHLADRGIDLDDLPQIAL